MSSEDGGVRSVGMGALARFRAALRAVFFAVRVAARFAAFFVRLVPFFARCLEPFALFLATSHALSNP
jgi:hypothetical protein